MFKPSPPFNTIEEEFDERTRKFFADWGESEIIIRNRREVFQLMMAEYCINSGWLEKEEIEIDEQNTIYRYSPTDEGRAHWKI